MHARALIQLRSSPNNLIRERVPLAELMPDHRRLMSERVKMKLDSRVDESQRPRSGSGYISSKQELQATVQ